MKSNGAHEIESKTTKKGKVFSRVGKLFRNVLNFVKAVAQMKIMSPPHRTYPEAQPNPEKPAKKARETTTTPNAHEVEIGEKKKRKVQQPNAHEVEIGKTKKRKVHQSLFGNLPDELVMNVLSYGNKKDIHRTRVWQSKKVQHLTVTTSKIKAAENNNLDNMIWIYESIGDTDFYSDKKGPSYTGKTIKVCIGKEFHNVVVEWAVTHGNLSMLKWLNEKGCPWCEYTFAVAILYGSVHGSLEVMEWLKLNDCPRAWNTDTFFVAARHGNFSILKWLHENGCPWDEWTFTAATEHGQLEVLEWLKLKECPWDNHAMYVACRNDDIEIIEWLKLNGCPGSWIPEKMDLWAAQNGNL